MMTEKQQQDRLLMGGLPEVTPDTVLVVHRGSHAHGTTLQSGEPQMTDDIDYMSVVVPGREYFLGLDQWGSRGTQEIKRGPVDLVTYEIRKFVGLLAKGNPNVVSSLWAPTLYCSSAGLLLRHERHRFTRTKAVVRSHLGYASDQLEKMRKSPTEAAYMGARRRQLALRYGYDVKHASHLLRLLAMVIELQDYDELIVDRRSQQRRLLIGAEELKAVKRGEWKVELVLERADGWFRQARRQLELNDWPERVDTSWASQLTQDVVQLAWDEQTPRWRRVRGEGISA